MSDKSNFNFANKAIIILVAVFAFFFFSSLWGQGPLKPGQRAPVFTVPVANQGGGALNLEDLKGKPIVLVFWSTTCPPCIKKIPVLESINRNHRNDLTVLAVASEGESLVRLKEFAQKRGISYLVASDLGGEISRNYGVSRLPTLFIIDSELKIVKTHTGYMNEKTLISEVRKVL